MNTLYEKKLENIVHLKRTEEEWINQLNMFNNLGGAVFVAGEEISAFCFVWAGEEIWVQEIFYGSEEDKNALIGYIGKIYGEKKIKITEYGNKKRFASAKLYNGKKISGYMNLMYN